MFSKDTKGTPVQDARDTVRELHKHSDVDFDTRAQHHTLGKGEFQAASGAWVASLEARIKALEDA